jgi:hypothetical protein
MPGQCGKELGFSGMFGGILFGIGKIVRAASYKLTCEWFSVEPVKSMAPGSVRKPLVTLFQRSRLEECLWPHNRAAPAGRFPLWSRAYFKTTQVNDAGGSCRTHPA